MLATELKRWTICNTREGKIFECSDEEFKKLLDKGGLKLEGKYVIIDVHSDKFKQWIDCSINN